jgi:putative intracellular protease/amidase
MIPFARLAAPLLLCLSLVSATALAAAPAPDAHPRKRVAILLFDGVEIIDYSGPYEVFGAADYDVYTVGRSKTAITTSMGLTVVPKYDFADAPAPDVVVVPGGNVRGPRADPVTLKWIRDETARDQHTMSVCNGALILADAGLLDGLEATTTFYWIPRMRAQYPKIHIVDDRRFADNGKIVTTAGLSAGIDGALHLVEVMDGPGQAQNVALGIEYDWRPKGGFVRAALADAQIPTVDFDHMGAWKMLRTEGSVDHWEMVVGGRPDRAPAQIMDQVAKAFTADHWTRVAGGSDASKWSFTGHDGKPWTGALKLEPGAGQAGSYVLTLVIGRA